MSLGISPLVAQAIVREQTAELTRTAERARLIRAARGPRATHRLRTLVITIAGPFCVVLVALPLG